MGVSTDGLICYGILLGEVEFPWDDEDDDIEEWWAFTVHGEGYAQTIFPFDEDGDWNTAAGFSEEKHRSRDLEQRVLLNNYHDERSAHKKSVPALPIKMVNTCSDSAPVWIAAVPGSHMSASRGYPVQFDPKELDRPLTYEALKGLRDFLQKYYVDWMLEEHDEEVELAEPAWYLGSYWG